jgi:hypothetical protein
MCFALPFISAFPAMSANALGPSLSFPQREPESGADGVSQYPTATAATREREGVRASERAIERKRRAQRVREKERERALHAQHRLSAQLSSQGLYSFAYTQTYNVQNQIKIK